MYHVRPGGGWLLKLFPYLMFMLDWRGYSMFFTEYLCRNSCVKKNNNRWCQHFFLVTTHWYHSNSKLILSCVSFYWYVLDLVKVNWTQIFYMVIFGHFRISKTTRNKWKISYLLLQLISPPPPQKMLLWCLQKYM